MEQKMYLSPSSLLPSWSFIISRPLRLEYKNMKRTATDTEATDTRSVKRMRLDIEKYAADIMVLEHTQATIHDIRRDMTALQSAFYAHPDQKARADMYKKLLSQEFGRHTATLSLIRALPAFFYRKFVVNQSQGRLGVGNLWAIHLNRTFKPTDTYEILWGPLHWELSIEVEFDRDPIVYALNYENETGMQIDKGVQTADSSRCLPLQIPGEPEVPRIADLWEVALAANAYSVRQALAAMVFYTMDCIAKRNPARLIEFSLDDDFRCCPDWDDPLNEPPLDGPSVS
jgi:hypothetical protein